MPFLTHSYILVTAYLPFPHELLLPLLLPTTLERTSLSLPVCTGGKVRLRPSSRSPSQGPVRVWSAQPPACALLPTSSTCDFPLLSFPAKAAQAGRERQEEEGSPSRLQLCVGCREVGSGGSGPGNKEPFPCPRPCAHPRE